MDTKLWEYVDRKLTESDVSGAIDGLERLLAAEKGERFKGLLGTSFSNSPTDILAEINDFVEACVEQFDIKAVYLEMNGFDINPDRWYFDSFGYGTYGCDPKNLEWLCNW